MPLKYFTGYPEATRARVSALIAQDRPNAMLRDKYRQNHAMLTDKALYDYTQVLKERYLRKTESGSGAEKDGWTRRPAGPAPLHRSRRASRLSRAALPTSRARIRSIFA